jgi:uncharacterized DUF497 family protein
MELAELYDGDPAKERANVARHGLTFLDEYRVLAARAVDRLTFQDLRKDYGEDRWITLGVHPLIPDSLIHVTYTWRGNRPRFISVRRANRRERKRYADRHA